MIYDQIPEEYRKILIKASQGITPASLIIAEEIQDTDTIELALINICERFNLTASNLLYTISELENDKDYEIKTAIDVLMFDDSYFVTKVECIEKNDERFYIIEREDGNKYKISEKLIEKGNSQ